MTGVVGLTQSQLQLMWQEEMENMCKAMGDGDQLTFGSESSRQN